MNEYIDKYKKRVQRSGRNIGEALHSNTLAFKESTFEASTSFRVLTVDSTEFPDITKIDSRVVGVERLGNLREILFRPNQFLNIGTYVFFDGDDWLIFDKFGDVNSGVKCLAEKCNRILKWKDKNGEILSVKCVVSAMLLGSKSNQGRNDIEFNNYDVSLPVGKLFAFTEANQITRSITMNQRFVFGSNIYEVHGIDDVSTVDKNGFGVIQFTLKITTKQSGDDFQNQIAVNYYEESTGVQGERIW